MAKTMRSFEKEEDNFMLFKVVQMQKYVVFYIKNMR